MVQPIQNGSGLSLTRQNVNEIIEATNTVRGGKLPRQNTHPIRTSPSSVIGNGRNDGAEITSGSAVSITGPLVDAGDEFTHAVAAFRSQMSVAFRRAFNNSDETAADHFPQNLAVTTTGIANGGVGDIIVSGLAYARVDLKSANDSVAVAHDEDGNQGIFKGASVGRPGCRIVAKPSLLGEQWCIVSVGLYPTALANAYRGTLSDALETSDLTILVGNLVAVDGLPPTSESIGAYNTLTLSGASGDAAYIIYNDQAGRWELIEVQC